MSCLEKWSTSAFVDLSSVDLLNEGGHLDSIPKRVGEHCQALNENSCGSVCLKGFVSQVS